MKTLRDRYIALQRDLRIQSIYRDPDLQINQPAIDALVNKVDPTKLKPGQRVPPDPSIQIAPAAAARSSTAPSTPPAAAIPAPAQAPPAALAPK